MNSLLLLSPKPYDDESFLGYMTRIAQINGYDRLSWLAELGGYKLVNLPNTDSAFLANKKQNIARIAKLIGIEPQDIQKQLLIGNDGRLGRYQNQYSFKNQIVPKLFFNVRRKKICPQCLHKNEYIRRIWDIKALTVCPIHQTLLIDACPDCGKNIDPCRTQLSICKCGFDWRNTIVNKVNEDDSELSWLISKLSSNERDAKEKDWNTTNPLLRLDVSSVLILMNFFLKNDSSSNDRGQGTLLINRTNGELHVCLMKAYNIFRNWPAGFHDYLRQLRTITRKTKCVTGLGRDFGVFHRSLYTELEGSQYDFLRNEFKTYMATWDGGVLISKRNKNNIGEQWQFCTISKASRLLKMTPAGIKLLIKDGHIESISKEIGRRTLTLLKIESINELVAKKDKSLSITAMQYALSIGKKAVADLVKHGLLNQLTKPSIHGHYRTYRFAGNAANILMEALEQKVVPDDKSINKKISLLQILKSFPFQKLKLSGIIEAILDDKLRLSGVRNIRGLGRFMLSREAITEFQRASGKDLRNISMSITEAGQKLNLGGQAIYRLITRNIIKSTKVIYNGRILQRVIYSEIDMFKSKYIALTTIAAQYNIRPQELIVKLIANGIIPATGRKIDGGIKYYFRKNDILCVDIAQILKS